MRHLAGDHVDLVAVGHGDEHVGIGGTGALEHVRAGGKTKHALHIERVAELLDELRPLIDHGDVILLGRELASDVEAHLPGAADDDFHGASAP